MEALEGAPRGATASGGGGRGALVFIGFMGAGKSTAARVAAGALDTDPIDTDERLERELEMPIRLFFAERGEEEFRRREEALCQRVLGEAAAEEVIALGGGAILSPRVREALDPHLVVLLEVSPTEAWERVGAEPARPLAADREAFEALHGDRLPHYESLADAFLPAGDFATVSAALPHLLSLGDAPAGTKLLWAASESASYPALIGRGLLDSGIWPLGGRRFCVTDTTVGHLYADRLGPLGARVEVEPGEENKTIPTAERIWGGLASAGMTREDHLAALGGGVVGDLAGFCAATYQRGVPIVQVPTTLAAQVDSAYGGKTGVDIPEAKNYVGAYHLPAGVIADTETLATLPPEELASGLAEVVKTALIAGGALWERVRGLGSPDPTRLEDVILACARTKIAVVAEDERDAGRRAVLNLGHTAGHAIEAASDYSRYRHGEAVGLGLLAALRLSGAGGLRDEVEEILRGAGLPTTLDSAVGTDAVLAALERDKKRTARGVEFVLLERPGEPRTGRLLDAAGVRGAIEELTR
jgi:shikimate kinase / 3-dehydroquinate synthase